MITDCKQMTVRFAVHFCLKFQAMLSKLPIKACESLKSLVWVALDYNIPVTLNQKHLSYDARS